MAPEKYKLATCVGSTKKNKSGFTATTNRDGRQRESQVKNYFEGAGEGEFLKARILKSSVAIRYHPFGPYHSVRASYLYFFIFQTAVIKLAGFI